MTDIEWSDESWNPIRARLRSDPTVIGWHCEHATPGCENCYSETRNRSGRCNMGTKLPYKPGHRKDIEVYIDQAQLVKPLSWRKGKKIFVCSMTDVFAEFVTDSMLDRIFAVMALCPQHTFQVLTKRSARMWEYLGGKWRIHVSALINSMPANKVGHGNEFTADFRLLSGEPLPNVWLGVSVEDQQRADERIPDLLATPAAVRWISAEPLLGPVDLTAIPYGEVVGNVPSYQDALTARIWQPEGTFNRPLDPRATREGRTYVDLCSGLDWVVLGGESGKGARPMHPDWARSLRDQCAAAGVAFFFKQWGVSCPLRAELIPVERRNIGWVARDGRFKFDCREADHKPMYRDDDRYGAGYWSQTVRVGKKRAGRLLDGVEHNGMPGQA